ncbi:D-alanyl-D-alanine carboxypeptidase [Microbacterium sp. NPDC055910]|uniref:D-alanyl-D-alanine carboxypeptidase n=1 Tax=Microbacterium sp. NPDC055910 TaxID=3345659 RepID=UPI0035DC8AC3
MAPDITPPPSRRALRNQAAMRAVTATLEADEAPTASATTTDVTLPSPDLPRTSTDAPAITAGALSGRRALAWVDSARVGMSPVPAEPGPDLLGRGPRRSPLRAGVLVPASLVALVVGAYAATTLLWPLHAVAPTIEAIGVQPVAAAEAALPWPDVGAAAVAVDGFDTQLASMPEPLSIASITKVVTALAVLEEMPLELGEAGPEYRFTGYDRTRYWQYRANGESALDVPVGGALTQYQMLEGMLIASGNNYADRLATTLWPTDEIFAEAANGWLRTHGVEGIEVVEPTGLDPRNIATPAALLTLAQKALAHPVIAEIVAKRSVDLPGVGVIENTNRLLEDAGVIGVKTGTLDTWNVLTAKDVMVGETPVRVYASVLGQPDGDARVAVSRALYAQIETELQPRPSVEAGTTVGRATTAWGANVPIVTAEDAAVVLWNGSAAAVSTAFDLGDARAKGATVGELSAVGPLDRAAVPLRLSDDIADPDAWWRLTHPLELFGLTS